MNTTPLKTIAVVSLGLGLGSVPIASNPVGGQPPQATRASQSTPSGAAPSEGPAPQNQTTQNQTPPAAAIHEDPRGWHARALIGREVVGVNDVKLGRLDDFIVDSDSGGIVYGVVSSTGTKGSGQGLRAVPFALFLTELSDGELRMRLNVDEAAWTKAPQFEKSQLGFLSEESILREDVYQHFGGQPPLRTRPDEQLLVLVGELIGKPLLRGDQTIGKVEDVIVHLDARMAAVLLDPRDEFAGTDQKFILPFDSLDRTEDDTFSTTLSSQDFTAAQASSDASWALSGLFRAPYMWPAYGTTATPLTNSRIQNRGVSASRPPVEEIRQALASDVHTRGSAVRVIAAHDRVILQGTVQDEDDRRRVENRAAQSAGGWKIDNQLRTAEDAVDYPE